MGARYPVVGSGETLAARHRGPHISGSVGAREVLGEGVDDLARAARRGSRRRRRPGRRGRRGRRRPSSSRDVEAGAEHQAQVVERASASAVELLLVELARRRAVASTVSRAASRRLEQLVADELLVLAVPLGVLVVGGGEQAPERSGRRWSPSSSSRSWSTRSPSSSRSSVGQARRRSAPGAGALDPPRRTERPISVSCCIVAHSPCSWRRKTCELARLAGPVGHHRPALRGAPRASARSAFSCG